jgi:glutaredoxin
MTVVTLYGKPGCHLCEDARRIVGLVGREHEFELREVDVSLDPALNRDYGERVPVIAVDGVEHFQFYVTRAALAELVSA